MIIQALNDYYNRLKEDEDIDIPKIGFSRQKIHFELLIDRDGKLLQVLDLRETQGKKVLPKQLIVPEAVIRTSGRASNFLWDNTGYVLGADDKENSKQALEKFKEFKELHRHIGDNFDDEGMKAVVSFLNSWEPKRTKEVISTMIKNWDEFAGKNLVFRLDGYRQYIHERPKIKEAWLKYYQAEGSKVTATCLVSGKQAPIARVHQKIKGVWGAQTSGASLISFNLDSFLSYGKEQNLNAPVSEEIAFAYTTALNQLLRFESRQKVQIGDTTTIFWTERASPIEGFMGQILDPREEKGDLKDVRLFLEAIRDGKMPTEIDEPDMKFYILGLSPNASRLSVRFWHVSTVGDIVSKIGQHFRDLSIIKNYDNEDDFPGMWQLLRETSPQYKTDSISPLLAGTMLRSILTGTNYPYSLLVAVINRIRADQTISYLRAARIKAYLARRWRIKNISKEVIAVSLNKESVDIGYRLGRLFAALEKAQKDAIPGAGSTIKDRYYGAASATPRTVFPQLLRLAQHHIQKAEYGGISDKMIEEIMQKIQSFPANLSLEKQGMFALGYYHQKRDFYSKVEKKKEDEK